MHLFAIVVPLASLASVDPLDTDLLKLDAAPVLSAYGVSELADLQVAEPAEPVPSTRLRLGAVSITWTQATTDQRAHTALSRLLRQRTAHLDHCSHHAPDHDAVQVDLTFAELPQLHADGAPELAECLQKLAAHWPVPAELMGARASLRLVVEIDAE